MSKAQQVKLAKVLRVDPEIADALIGAGMHTPRLVRAALVKDLDALPLSKAQRDLVRARRDEINAARSVSRETH